MTSDIVRMKTGWLRSASDMGADLSGLTGTVLARVFSGQEWAVVLWSDREDPCCFKSAGLEAIGPVAKREPQ